MREILIDGKAIPQQLSPGEVAALFGVNPKTVIRWAQEGKLTAIRTPGGHRRFPADQFTQYFAQDAQ